MYGEIILKPCLANASSYPSPCKSFPSSCQGDQISRIFAILGNLVNVRLFVLNLRYFFHRRGNLLSMSWATFWAIFLGQWAIL
jgi:hypothetical protein